MKGQFLTTLILPVILVIFPCNASAINDEVCVKNNCVNGYGVITSKFIKYEGNFKDGEKHGKGTLTFTNGTKFDGSFLHNKKHGTGTIIFVDGSRYVGEWRHGRMNGHGTFAFADGEIYIGDWKDGMMHGHGALYKPDGTRYIGTWFDNDKHGMGLAHMKNGRKTIGYWAYGKYIGAEADKRYRLCECGQQQKKDTHLSKQINCNQLDTGITGS